MCSENLQILKNHVLHRNSRRLPPRAKELMVGLMGAPPTLREPTRKAAVRRGAGGGGEYRLGDKGGLHVEPLPAWLEKRVRLGCLRCSLVHDHNSFFYLTVSTPTLFIFL